ncbi:hypothetical protein HPB49_013286 [Dermacentor silvarum]|uniref:Uncharacterized protein n=1 Tax=Dermacentor silvarum TaxID=543639 RepID=A0ACB8CRK5_DERSI|nr:hypothetical protein HPB49_013286 [Dermacentor silvarum]
MQECPTCRKKLVSKRSLRADPNFDMLIAKIYPSRDEYEAHQERVLAKLNRQHSQALAHSIEEGMRMQALNRNQRVRKHGGDENNGSSGPATPAPPRACQCRLLAQHQTVAATSRLVINRALSHALASASESARQYEPCEFAPQAATCSNDTESAGGETEETDAEDGDAALNSEIELVFKPQPQMMLEDSSAQVRYIKTTANATVDHLSKYLAMRLALDKFEQDASAPRSVAPFVIYIAVTPGQFTPLQVGCELFRTWDPLLDLDLERSAVAFLGAWVVAFLGASTDRTVFQFHSRRNHTGGGVPAATSPPQQPQQPPTLSAVEEAVGAEAIAQEASIPSFQTTNTSRFEPVHQGTTTGDDGEQDTAEDVLQCEPHSATGHREIGGQPLCQLWRPA